MSKVLIIGAGGVSNVVAQKCAQNSQVFSELCIASRTESKCEAIAAEITNIPVSTAQLDADDVAQTVALIKDFKPKLVINVALPYQDLHIMDACLATGVNYLDTANYEPIDEAKFEYSWQWDYQKRFADAGLMALLGSGFDPGVTNVYTSYLRKHYFDQIELVDILDCNGGDHGQAFATNFNPEINIREITQKGKYYENGRWIEIDPMSVHHPVDYPGVGTRESYLLYHEEEESLVKHFPEIKRIRFWMTFGTEYIKHLQVLQNVGMTSIEPIMYQGQEIVPLQFLKALLPEPSSLGENYHGLTCIGVQVQGQKSNQDRSVFVYNNCDHHAAWQEVKGQAVAYTTGVPAMIGAAMMLTGTWSGQGVFNMEQFDPDPFMAELNKWGLPWQVVDNVKLI